MKPKRKIIEKENRIMITTKLLQLCFIKDTIRKILF